MSGNDHLFNQSGDFKENNFLRALDGKNLIYVDGLRGGDNNPGTEARPFKTIGAAMTAASAALGPDIMKFIAVKPNAKYTDNIVHTTGKWCMINADLLKTGPQDPNMNFSFSASDVDGDGDPNDTQTRQVYLAPSSGLPILITNKADLDYDDIDYTASQTAYTWDGADLNGITSSVTKIQSGSSESYSMDIIYVGWLITGLNPNAGAKLLGVAAVGGQATEDDFYGLRGVSFVDCSISLGMFVKNCQVDLLRCNVYELFLDNCRPFLKDNYFTNLTIRRDSGADATEAPFTGGYVFIEENKCQELVASGNLNLMLENSAKLLNTDKGRVVNIGATNVTINGDGEVKGNIRLCSSADLDVNDTVDVEIHDLYCKGDLTTENTACSLAVNHLIVEGAATIGAASTVTKKVGGVVGAVTGTITAVTLN